MPGGVLPEVQHHRAEYLLRKTGVGRTESTVLKGRRLFYRHSECCAMRSSRLEVTVDEMEPRHDGARDQVLACSCF